MSTSSKVNLCDLPYPALERFVVEELGAKKFRAMQLWQWIWAKNASAFHVMTDISHKDREKLAQLAEIRWPSIADVRVSSDGTTKFLLKLSDGQLVETVLIPSEAPKRQNDPSVRITQCVSTQVGCAMACSFCSTGKLGFTRNMTMGEILGQIQVARAYVHDTKPESPIIRNIVYMGMGEPLLNLKNVMDSLRTLEHPGALAFSPRRVTVSTCGIEAGMREFGDSGLAFLAVSLHAPNQELRERLMPRAARWHLTDLISALEQYPLKTRERITLEYLVISGVNDQSEHVRQLARICARINAKINIIPYNPTPGTAYKAPTPEDLLRFEKALWAKGITAIVRKSKGQDIEAACGQLRASHDALSAGA